MCRLVVVLFFSIIRLTGISQDISFKSLNEIVVKFDSLNSLNQDYKLIIFQDSTIEEFKFKDYSTLKTYLIDRNKGYLENSYHHVEFKFQDIQLENSTVKVFYRISLNNKFKLNSIKLINEARGNEFTFLEKFVNNNFVNRSNTEIISFFKNLSYIDLNQEELNYLSDSTYDLILNVNRKKSNYLNGVIGLLPNSYNSNDLNLTADIKLGFYNIAQKGVQLEVNWQKNLFQSQFLFVNSTIPFILNTPFSLNALLDLEKVDTSFLRVSYQVGLSFNSSYNQSYSLILKNQMNSIININKEEVLSGKLPPYIDNTVSQVGFGYRFNSLNNKTLYKKGWFIQIQSLIGFKTIIVNQQILNLKDLQGNSYARLYDSIDNNLFQNNNSIEVEKYTPIFKKIVLKNRFEIRNMNSSIQFENDAYFIGGILGPRGFDDKSFRSINFTLLVSEPQFFITKNIYSSIFVDVAVMKEVNTNLYTTPIGFGLGFCINNKNSIFEFYLANGSSSSQDVKLDQSKIHFKYVSLF